jgi:hypothetical protein
MATTSSETFELTIDREARDVLRAELDYEGARLESFDHAIRDWDRGEAVRLHRTAGFVIDLLDQLGWDDEETDREEFEIAIDRETLVEWLDRRANELVQSVAGEALRLRQQQRGDANHFYAGSSQEESIESTRRSMQLETDRLEIFDALLRQTVRPVAAVA